MGMDTKPTLRQRLKALESQMEMCQLTADGRRYDRLREEWQAITDTKEPLDRTNQ